MKYILASASPRRKILLKEIVDSFYIIPSEVEEVVDNSLSPKEIVKSLAYQKAKDVADKYPDCTVFGYDTVVVYGDKIYGKPKDKEDAFDTLKKFSGNYHSVMTGVCIIRGNKVINDCDESRVLFNELSDGFIKDYVESGSPMDKAGSYNIQDKGLVKSYEGSFSNIVGLPVELTKKLFNLFTE